MSTVRLRSVTTCGSNRSEMAVQADCDEGKEVEEEKPVQEEIDFGRPFLFSDAVLIVEGRKLHCHRAILSIFSPVFRAMFKNKCIENLKNEVIINADSYTDVLEMLTHMYTPGGKEMSSESAQNLLPLLHRYQIDSMVQQAEQMLTFRLNAAVAPSCLRLADIYGLARLRQAALEACARLDAAKLRQVTEECKLSFELRTEILERRVTLLETCLNDIERSFTHSCVRMENRMERVPSNHCSEHPGPLTNIQIQPSTNLHPTGPSDPESNGLTAGMEGHNAEANVDGPQFRHVNASIRPARVAADSLESRPVQLGLGATNPAPEDLPQMTDVPAPVSTAVCEQCVDQFKEHIIQLCRRGLNKIPIVMCKQTSA